MKPDDYLLPIVSVILILLFILWLVWYYYQNKPANVNTTIFCPVGQCATNVYSGTKVCPATASDAVSYTVGLEVCNPPQACTNTTTPFALEDNFGTNDEGLCQDNNCNCLQQNQCPEYITTYFVAVNDRPFQPLNSSRIVLEQRTQYVDQAGILQNSPPYSLSRIGIEFCSIPVQWLNRIYPRECLTGVRAFLAPNTTDVTLENAAALPISCVTGEKCENDNEQAMWNTNTNKLECVNLCQDGEILFWDADTQKLVCVVPTINNVLP